MTNEQPDAIGWMANGWSFLVECKMSRSDFFRDQRKRWRRFPSSGMGNYRFYFTPSGLLATDELPERWGLLEVQGNAIRCIRDAVHVSEKHLNDEIALLVRCATPPELVKRQPPPTSQERERRREERKRRREERIAHREALLRLSERYAVVEATAKET